MKINWNIRPTLTQYLLGAVLVAVGYDIYTYEVPKPIPVVAPAPVVEDNRPIIFDRNKVTFDLDQMKQGKLREQDTHIGKQFSIDSSNPKYAGLSAYVVLFEPKDKLNHLAPYIDVGIVKK